MSWRRIVLLSLALVAVLGGVTWSVLQHSDAATQVVRRELQALLATPTEVASTALDLGRGRLSVRGVRIADPTRAGATLLTLDEVAVDVAIANGSSWVDVHAITVDGFAIEAGPTFPDLASLLVKTAAAPTGPKHIPPIELRGGRVRLVLREGQAPLEWVDVAIGVLPHQERPQLQVRGSALLREFGAKFTVLGDIDPESGAGLLVLSTAAVPITATTVARITELLGIAPTTLTPGATVRSLQITVHLPGAGGSPRFELAAELTDVRVEGEGLPSLITAATVSVQGSSADGGSVAIRVQQTTARGTLDATARVTHLQEESQAEVRVIGHDLAIDADVLTALNLFDIGRNIVQALQPTAGRADLELFLRNPHRRLGITELDITLREVAVAFHGFGKSENRAAFPLPMEHTRGRIRLRDDVLLLEDIHASIAASAGGGSVDVQGRVLTARPSGEDVVIDIHGEGVAFSPDLRAALATLLDDDGALYDKFAPVGRTEVDIQLRPESELPGGWAVDVRPSASSMQWAGFPYRLDQLRGAVRARTDGVTFDLAGQHGDGRLAMRGFIPLGPASPNDKGFVAAVTLETIVLDDDLRRAVAVLAPDLDSAWQASAASGRFSGQVKVWRPLPTDPLYHDARLDLAGVDLRLPAAPWRAVGLHGQLIVQGLGDGTRVDFDALRGELHHGGDSRAKLAMLGHVVVGKTASEELAFVVRDLELDEQLGATLEQLGALGAGTWASLDPSGRVDLVCRHQRTGSTAEPLGLVVHLLDVRCDAPILLRPAEHMTGELQVANGELRFDDVRATLGGALVQCSAGRVRTRPAPDQRTEISFTVNANGVPIDDGVANLFSGPLRTAVLQRQLLGRADVDSLQLQFAIPSATSTGPFETTLKGQLRLYDLDMTLGQGADGMLVHGITGVANLAASTVSDAGGQLRGALRGVSLRMFGQPFEAIDAAFLADAEHITIEALTARLHGGALRSARTDKPAIEYVLPSATTPDGPTPDGQLRADITFQNVDVFTFLDRSGWTNPPYSGAASGALTLDRLDGSSVLGAVGKGNLKIERANLGEVPLFTAIYAQLPPANRPSFDGLDLTWQVADRNVEFTTFNVKSNILAARGQGRLGFDGYLDVEMTLGNLLGASADPFVMPLLSYLAQNIVTFHLHGYLSDLRAEKRWVTESAPRRRVVVPMPPATPRPTAPDF